MPSQNGIDFNNIRRMRYQEGEKFLTIKKMPDFGEENRVECKEMFSCLFTQLLFSILFSGRKIRLPRGRIDLFVERHISLQ